MKLRFLALGFFVGTAATHAAPAPSPVPRKLDLRQCLEIALIHNPQLRTASAQFLAAEGTAMQLHAILYPSVSAQGLTTPLTFYVQIQEILYSHATLPQLRLSRLTGEQALLNYRQALIDVVYQLRQAFTTELGARRLAALDRQLIQGREAALKTEQDLFNAGHAQRGEVLQVQVLTGLARQNDALADLHRQQAAIALRTVLGINLPDTVELQGDLEQDAGPRDLDVGKLSTEALRDRQDLKLLENARLSAAQQVEIDVKSAYPVAGFESNSAFQPPTFLPGSASYDLNRNFDEPQTQRQPGNTQLPLSLYLTWSIFDGGNLAGVRQGEEAKLASQAVAIDALRRGIPGEVASAVTSILAERKILDGLDAQTPLDQVRQGVDADYQSGRVRLLDKVNLESDIVRQRQLRLESQIRLHLALAALDHALGRGVEIVPSKSPLSKP